MSFSRHSTTISTLHAVPLCLLGDNYIIRSGWVLHHCCLITDILLFFPTRSAHVTAISRQSLRYLPAVVHLVPTSSYLTQFFNSHLLFLFLALSDTSVASQAWFLFRFHAGMLEYDPAKRFSIQKIRQHRQEICYLPCLHQCTALSLHHFEWSSCLFFPAGCVRNTLRLRLPCPSLPAQRAGIPGGAWRWCPTWRTCTATQRTTTTSSTTEKTRSYTLRTLQCQVSVDLVRGVWGYGKSWMF